MSNAMTSTRELSTESENSKPKRLQASFEVGEVAGKKGYRQKEQETEVEQGWTKVLKKRRKGLFTSTCFCSY